MKIVCDLAPNVVKVSAGHMWLVTVSSKALPHLDFAQLVVSDDF